MRLAILLLALLLLAAAPTADEAGSSRARAVALRYAEQSHGTLLFRVATQTEIHGGPIHRSEMSEALYLALDGGMVRKRYLYFRRNGRDLDARNLGEKSEEAETPLSRFGLRLPYLRATLGDYRFDAPIDRGATIEVPFHAILRDQSHGDGRMLLDRATDRIERIDETPAVMPPRATSGSVSVIFGPTVGDRWDIIEIDHDFVGQMGLLHGSLHSATHYDRYVPYADATRGLAALAALDG
jgi:hypothetical protein